MKFDNDEQRKCFKAACKGNWRAQKKLSESMAARAMAAMLAHNARAAVAGTKQDPLRIRAKWDSHDQCTLHPEMVAWHAISGARGPCFCRLCRLKMAAFRMREHSSATMTRQERLLAAWSLLPEASLYRQPAHQAYKGNEPDEQDPAYMYEEAFAC